MRYFALAVVVSVQAFGAVTFASGQTLVQLAPLKTYVSQLGSDPVGLQLAYNVRELLARSATYPKTERPESAAVVLLLASVDLDSALNGPDGGHAAAVSYTITYDVAAASGRPDARKQLTYVSSGVMIVGRQKIGEMAAGIIATVDAALRGVK